MVKIFDANDEILRELSRILLKILEDKNGEIYQENVAKFGIPEEYARKAFFEENLLKLQNSGKVKFYLAMGDDVDTLHD